MMERERAELDRYIKENQVEKAIQDIVQNLFAAKPNNPRQWLLEMLEQELSSEKGDISEADLHRLFAVTRKINAQIMPQETIDLIISETLKLLNCNRVSLFVYDKKMNMLRLYASDLATPIMVSPGQGIAGSVFNQRELVNIPDCYQDHRFDRSWDHKTGYMTKSLIAVPILDFDGSSAGVIQAINKLRPGTSHVDIGNSPVGLAAVPFGRRDEKMLLHLTEHISIAMRNADVYREAVITSERSVGLLNTIQSLSQDLGKQSMVLTITMHATKVVSSEHATVFLLDESAEHLWSVSTDTGEEIQIPKKAGIAGLCCTQGKVINIADAHSDSRFNQEVDGKAGFKTQSILAIPMIDEASLRQQRGEMASIRPSASRKSMQAAAAVGAGGPASSGLLPTAMDAPESPQEEKHAGESVIGVIQMINKVSYDGQHVSFDESDIQVMELFAKFVGPKLVHSSMMVRRATEQGEKKEAELALGKTAMAEMEGQGDRARKRLSTLQLLACEEEDGLEVEAE